MKNSLSPAFREVDQMVRPTLLGVLPKSDETNFVSSEYLLRVTKNPVNYLTI